MSDSVTRRDFLSAAAAVSAVPASTGLRLGSVAPVAPFIRRSSAATTVAVSSANGLPAVRKATELVLRGVDTLDAAVEGVKIQELDPNDDSVGYGGLPNEDGVVQLDASCVHGPTRRAGGVAALEGIKTPSEIARLIALYTTHVLLVGEGAKKFAMSYGYKDEDLLTQSSREKWLRWRANRGHDDDWIDIPDGQPVIPRPTGTINLDIINAKGEISSITTTSGLAWKIAGRAGDSPIVGAGQYTDPDIGAAGSTGLGEANIMVCGGFLTVEHMRRGLKPTDAALETLKRVVAMTQSRLLDANGRPKFQVNFYALNKKGEFGSASLYPSRYAYATDKESKITDTAYLFEPAK